MSHAAALDLFEEAPSITPGLWRMRNGHTASVENILRLPYGAGHFFPVWKGLCVECNEPKTWNTDGTYAVAGEHPLDITGRAN